MKRERRAAKADGPTTTTKGPEIAWDEAVRYVESARRPPSEVSLVPTDDSSD